MKILRTILERAFSGLAENPSPSLARRQSTMQLEQDLPVFVMIDFDVRWKNDSGNRTAILEPGKSYRITLRIASSAQGRKKPEFFLQGDEVTIALVIENCPEVTIFTDADLSINSLTPSASITLRRSQIKAGEKAEFRLAIPEGSPKRRGFLTVKYTDQRAQYPQDCIELGVLVDSTKRSWTKEDAHKWHVDPSSPVPANIAFIYVQEREEATLTLSVWSQDHAFEPEHELRRPDLSPARAVQQREHIDDYIGRLHSFSSQQILPIQTWLGNLLHSHGNSLILIIIDTSAAEIPWEMIHLGYETGYLGANAEVVRWVRLIDYRIISLWIEDRLGTGCTVGYVDPTFGTLEGAEFSQLGARLLKDLHDLRGESFEQDATGVALLYLACHGKLEFSETRGSIYKLYSRADKAEIFNLDVERQQRLSVPLPAVIVNACDSGRLGPGGEGLPNVFLRKLTDGFIGTLCEVDQGFAATIGTKILQTVREAGHQGLRLSEALRLLRSETYQVNNKNNKECSLILFFTFMYVYYGNPLIRVTSIRPSPTSQEAY